MRTASCMALCPTRYGSRSLWEAKRMSSGPAHPGVWSGLTVRRHQGLLCGGPRTRQRCAMFRSPSCTSYPRPRSAHRPCLGPLFPFPPNCANGRKTKPQRSWPTRSSSSKTAPQKVLGPRSWPWPDFADEGVQTVLECVMVSGEHPNATAYRQTADAFRSGDQPARLWSMST